MSKVGVFVMVRVSVIEGMIVLVDDEVGVGDGVTLEVWDGVGVELEVIEGVTLEVLEKTAV